MRVLNLDYRSADELRAAAARAGIQDGPQLLVQIFTSETAPAAIRRVQAEIGKVFPQALIVGASTAGQLAGPAVLDAGTVVSCCEFARTRLDCIAVPHTDQGSVHTGAQLGEALRAHRARAAIVLATGLNSDGDALLAGIQHSAPEVIVAGGLAAHSGGESMPPVVFTRDRIVSGGAVAVALVNPELRVHSQYALGWLPLGRQLAVSGAQGTLLESIEDQPALAVYTHHLSEAAARDPYAVGILFPLMSERHGRLIARAYVGTEQDGAIRLMGGVRTGEKIRFGVFDTTSLMHTLSRNLTELAAFAPEAVFAYSCVARKLTTRQLLEAEIAHLNGLAPTAGFLGFGEFFHERRRNLFFNYSTTVLALSEASPPEAGDTAPVRLEPRFSQPDLQLKVLSHLVNVTATELENANLNLERLASIDTLTQTYNRRKIQEILHTEALRSERYGEPLCVVLFDIDDFKQVNDRHGHAAGDAVLRGIAEAVKGVIRQTDHLGRWGGEEFLLLCIGTDAEGGRQLAERVRRAVHTAVLPENIRATISLGIAVRRAHESTDALLQRADAALYRAKQGGKNAGALAD